MKRRRCSCLQVSRQSCRTRGRPTGVESEKQQQAWLDNDDTDNSDSLLGRQRRVLFPPSAIIAEFIYKQKSNHFNINKYSKHKNKTKLF